MPTVRLTSGGAEWTVPSGVTSIDLAWDCALWLITATADISSRQIAQGGSATASGSRSGISVSPGNTLFVLATGSGDCWLDITYTAIRRASLVFEAGSPTVSVGITRRAAATFEAGSPVVSWARSTAFISDRFRIAERASAPRNTILTAIEIDHPSAFSPYRIVNDTRNRTIGGIEFARSRFEAKLLDDYERRAPRASIVAANTGRDLSDWFEQTGGGAGATVRILQALAVDDAAVDWEMTLDVADVQLDTARVTVRLGFDPLLGRPAVEMRYDPETAPGLF